jgi:hypothetical protein
VVSQPVSVAALVLVLAVGLLGVTMAATVLIRATRVAYSSPASMRISTRGTLSAGLALVGVLAWLSILAIMLGRNTVDDAGSFGAMFIAFPVLLSGGLGAIFTGVTGVRDSHDVFRAASAALAVLTFSSMLIAAVGVPLMSFAR